jgi:hypothetical protein
LLPSSARIESASIRALVCDALFIEATDSFALSQAPS